MEMELDWYKLYVKMIETENFRKSKNQFQDQTRGSIIKKKVEIEIEEGSF
jgi:hypothetical protein